jgi:sulfate transport system permease protein
MSELQHDIAAAPVHRQKRPLRTVGESAWVKWTLIGLATLALVFFLILPLVTIFIEAFRDGWAADKAVVAAPE